MNAGQCTCGESSRVLETRPSGADIRRQRECLRCGLRWMTKERRIDDPRRPSFAIHFGASR